MKFVIHYRLDRATVVPDPLQVLDALVIHGLLDVMTWTSFWIA